ncbi:ribonuclease 2-like [Tripterygium wilfordii]|uniref:Ribonuclease 2-like n=1 Tax=Tripterygium wilfordii TaxID=458696 RepID=A0A7J7D4Q8_TRIWF|nr:ribonuclease 2-like [Tripterygium wilfordii]
MAEKAEHRGSSITSTWRCSGLVLTVNAPAIVAPKMLVAEAQMRQLNLQSSCYYLILAVILSEKHGTCSSPVVRDEYSYFLTTLNVYFKYNVTKVLSEAGYVPSNTEKYPLGGIVTAIQNAFHTTPSIVCSSGAVEELHLCFYKDFKPRDCATRLSIHADMDFSRSSCPKYVSLPAYVSLVGNWLEDISKSTGLLTDEINYRFSSKDHGQPFVLFFLRFQEQLCHIVSC